MFQGHVTKDVPVWQMQMPSKGSDKIVFSSSVLPHERFLQCVIVLWETINPKMIVTSLVFHVWARQSLEIA